MAAIELRQPKNLAELLGGMLGYVYGHTLGRLMQPMRLLGPAGTSGPIEDNDALHRVAVRASMFIVEETPVFTRHVTFADYDGMVERVEVVRVMHAGQWVRGANLLEPFHGSIEDAYRETQEKYDGSLITDMPIDVTLPSSTFQPSEPDTSRGARMRDDQKSDPIDEGGTTMVKKKRVAYEGLLRNAGMARHGGADNGYDCYTVELLIGGEVVTIRGADLERALKESEAEIDDKIVVLQSGEQSTGKRVKKLFTITKMS